MEKIVSLLIIPAIWVKKCGYFRRSFDFFQL
ncbi:unknown [[Mannheimia] succiniciproducens MBEL55E]|uniref:Uncharacterized protein n=1 Tax=Mannheimia succiniciproducens (strain KCTC 0769BP / MBEL55E) TaxID=221988 RepID=Q65UP6_MANSM|nr:unknown [[Mannheimia] succiniciproducens MBEL55E]